RCLCSGIIIGHQPHAQRNLSVRASEGVDESYYMYRQDDGGGHLRVGKHRKSSEGQVETFEAEGQLAASPEPEQHGLDSDTGLEQLRHVCSKLGVGRHGYLTQGELGRVCQFIGMEQMDDEELEELFSKLDMDHDGYISFDEFVSGLSQHSSSRSYDTPTRHVQASRPLSARKARTPLPPAQQDRLTPSTYVSGDTISLFSSLASSFTGFARGEDIVDYWENLGVTDGNSILMSLGFDPHSKIHLKELSSTLVSEWVGQMSVENTLGHAVSTLYRNELTYLRSALDQTSEERDKLKSDLMDALSRNALLAAEVDERHAQLEKSYEARLQSLEQHHTEQVRSLQTQLEKERESQSSQSASLKQTSEQIQELQQQVTTLQEKLATAETDLAIAKRELTQAREKQSDWELQYNRLKKEMQQQQQQQSELESPSSLSWEQEKQIAMETAERYAAENKELKDRNDELVAQLEELQQRLSSGHRRGSTSSQNRGASSHSRIPVFTRANSISSETSMDDDDLLSSTEGLFFNRHSVTAADNEHGEKAPSLSSELQQQQRMKRGERRERERKEIEHAYRIEIAELEDRFQAEKVQILDNFDKEKAKLSEELQGRLTERLAEQQKELQNAFTMEKQDLLQQYESKMNLMQVQHDQQVKELTERIRQEIQEAEKRPNSNSSDLEETLSLKIAEVEEEKAELEKKLEKMRLRYEAELQSHRIKSEQQLAELRASVDERVQNELEKVFSRGASALKGKLKDDFQHLVQHHQQHRDDHTTSDEIPDKEELCAAFEQEKLMLVNHYESQIVALQEELGALRQDFEAEHTAFQQLQSGDLAQTIRQEMQTARRLRANRIRAKMFPLQSISEQDEVSGQVDQLRQSWEEERRELAVQNQLLEEELADMKGMLMQERQRAAEAHSLRETVRRLRAENKEVECMAESLQEKLARGHQQQDMERANFERRIDELEREKERALRLQALQNAGPGSSGSFNAATDNQTVDVLEKVIQQVEAVQTVSPREHQVDQGNLDQLQGEITHLNHQLQEARTAQFEFQQLKEECEMLRQSNISLEDMVRTLRQRSEKDQTERKREEQEQLYDSWEERKKLQNLLQRTTDKLLKTSSEMAGSQTHLVREVEQLKQKAGNMVELETFTGLQVSLLETQRHAISLQEALTERTQLADRIMAEAEKERRQERDTWEEERRDMQGRLDSTMDMYRSLALQHKQLRQSSTKLGALVKDLYVENADLMSVLQHTEGKQRAAERRCRKLQERCQAWHDAVYRMYHSTSTNGE
ncbi:hypothetical protein BaRGS_00003348, partial [Batillaria attramentaria]